MRIAILGTGGIALGYAALLARDHHEVVLFSLSGRGGDKLKNQRISVDGAFQSTFEPQLADSMQKALDGASAVIVATAATSHRSLIDQIVPLIEDHQRILVSAELSMSGRYLASALQVAGKTNCVTALSTTILTARRQDPDKLNIGILRKSCKAATEPVVMQHAEIEFWRGIFGSVIEEAPSRMWIAFGNLNPTVHAGNALCNFTRIEKGEDWSNYAGITPGVANFTEAIDHERIKVAKAYEVEVVSLVEHYQKSFDFPKDNSLAQMTAALHERRAGLPKGPVTIETRYVTEDIPFGLVFLEHLAAVKQIEVPLHRAAIEIFSAIYKRDFRMENTLIDDNLSVI